MSRVHVSGVSHLSQTAVKNVGFSSMELYMAMDKGQLSEESQISSWWSG